VFGRDAFAASFARALARIESPVASSLDELLPAVREPVALEPGALVLPTFELAPFELVELELAELEPAELEPTELEPTELEPTEPALAEREPPERASCEPPLVAPVSARACAEPVLDEDDRPLGLLDAERDVV
jgi:hypothetical protein